ncbi:NUDIX hydrolase [Luteimonas sp. e5]
MHEPREILHQGRWLRLVRRGRWEWCERCHDDAGMAVMVAALTEQDEVLLVEQYRAALGARCIELPAGLVGDQDGDDSPEAAARRELIEETGWDAEHFEVALDGASTPGMSNERLVIMVAHGLREVGEGGGVDGEDIQLHRVPRRDVHAWLLRQRAAGKVLDLKIWAGLWLLQAATARRASVDECAM